MREKSGTMPATVEARIYEGTHGAYADSAEFGLAQTPLGGSTPRLRWEDEEPLIIVGGSRMMPRGGAREEDDMGAYAANMDTRNGARDWQIMEAPGDSCSTCAAFTQPHHPGFAPSISGADTWHAVISSDAPHTCKARCVSSHCSLVLRSQVWVLIIHLCSWPCACACVCVYALT
jgi:hypothetical protein